MPSDKPSIRRGMAIVDAARQALRAGVVVPVPPPHPATSTAAPGVPPVARPNRPRAPRPLAPRQLTAARQLLAGHSVSEVALGMGLHPYTVTRWKRDPRFQAELRRQVSVSVARQDAGAGRATKTNMAQHGATVSNPPARNEPTAAARASRYSDAALRAILAGLPRPPATAGGDP